MLLSASLVSVDRRLELPSPPLWSDVVRAYGNVIACLAAVVLATRQYCRVIVLPKDLCWVCQ